MILSHGRAAARTRRAILLGILATAPAIAAACGSGPATSPKPAQPGETAGKLTLALVGGEQQHPPVILDGFRTKFPKVQIETISGAWSQTLEKVAEMVAAGTPPDVWYGEDGRSTGWGPQGWIRDLAPYVKRDLKESEYYALSAAKDAEGRLWGVAGDLQVVALFYNTSALSEVGVKPPTPDWKLDDLVDSARRLTDLAKRQFGFFAQPNYITTSWYLFPKLFGTGVLDESGQKSQFNQPRVLQAYQSLMGFIDRGHAPLFVDQTKYPFAPAQGAEGRSALSFGIYGAMANPAYRDHTFDVELVPSGPATRWTTVIANVWVIGKTSSAPDPAWEWIKWHSQAEQQTTRASSGTGLPMSKKAAEDVVAQAAAPPKNRRAFLKSLDFAGSLGVNAVWQEWRTAAQNELIKAFRGEVSLPNALQETHRLVQGELDKFYKR